MKLIDILVEELPKLGGWPDGAARLAQDPDGDIQMLSNRHAYLVSVGWTGDGRSDFYGQYAARKLEPLASDYDTAIITREQYEAALAAKNEGWIEWDGGECPVADFLKVEYQLRGGAKGSESAKILEWQHEGGRHDIIAYRLHKPQEAEQAKANLSECIGNGAAQVWGGDGKPAIGEKCEHHSGGQWEAVTIAGIYENLVTGFTDYWMVKEDGSSYTVGNPYRFRPIRSEADRKRDEAVKTIMLTGRCQAAAEEIYDLIAAGKVPGVKLED